MSARIVTLPELGMISGSRAAIGLGAGLLLADRLNDDQRRAAGWTLLIVGAAITIPLFAQVMSRGHLVEDARRGGQRAGSNPIPSVGAGNMAGAGV